MKTRIRNKITAVFIVCGILFGVLVGTGFSSTIQQNREKAYAYEADNIDNISIGYIEVENAMFPMHGDVYLWQTAYETASHSNSIAMDVSSNDTYFIAPFSGLIVNYLPDSGYCNEFIYQSNKKVRWADDTLEKMSVYVLHSEDDEEITRLMKTPKNQGDSLVTQGQASGRGMRNSQYGIHLDIQVAFGAKNCFANNAAGNGEVLQYKAFFIGPETILHSTTNRALGVPESRDIYKGLWVENNAFRYVESNTSILKVTCPNSIAFEEEYSLWDYFVGHGLEDEVAKLATIQNIVNNYVTLEYEGLSDFEKKVYSACTYEWVDSVPDNTPNEHEVTTPKHVTITFDPGNEAMCEEKNREIAFGTCTYEFPIPRKNTTVMKGRFLGWYDNSGNVVTCDSIITEDITLYAKWEEFDLPEITTTTSPVTTTALQDNKDLTTEITVTRKEYQEPNIVTSPHIQESTVQEARVTEPVIERTPINVQSISLNRTSKMLNTGNSRTFSLIPYVWPTSADVFWSSSDSNVASVDSCGNVTAHKEGSCKIICTANGGNASASCNVTVKNEVNKTYGEWSEWSTNPIVSSSGLEVQTKQTTTKTPDRYKMVYYCTLSYDGDRIYSDTSINGQYCLFQRSAEYGEWSYMQHLGNQNYWVYYASELGEEIPPNSWLSGSQSGINKGSRSGYAVGWGNDTILAYIDEVYYKEETTTLYRYRTVTNIPVEYN